MSVPERVPMAVGENVIPIVQLNPTPMLEPQLLLATAKSPMVAMDENDKDELR